jgi:hypothetical protein
LVEASFVALSPAKAATGKAANKLSAAARERRRFVGSIGVPFRSRLVGDGDDRKRMGIATAIYKGSGWGERAAGSRQQAAGNRQ